MTPYPNLFSPLRVGPFHTPNRIVAAPHSTMYAEDNRVSAQHLAYYRARADGGAGIVMIGGLRVHPTTLSSGTQLSVVDEGCLPGLSRLAESVHAGGARVVGQLLHVGRQRNGGQSDLPVWAPSPLPCPVARQVPHAMTRAEIGEVVASFERAAGFCRAAGFDGVEIHAAHGYLPQQFLSPYSNVRSDEYGGTAERRLRFLLEVVTACRRAADGLAVGVRLSAAEFVEGGLSLPDTERIAPALVDAGAAFIDVSYSTYHGLSYASGIPEMGTEPGGFSYLARGIRRAIGAAVPVFAVGRIVLPEHAEAILAGGDADAVTMARSLIADPEWPRKAREGRAAEIRPCIGCNQGCAGMIHTGRRMRCLTNPVTGRELTWSAEPPRTRRPRRVVVVGAGPAGLEAALTAARRGHAVTVVERDAAPGGAARLAAGLHGRAEFDGCVRWRAERLAALGVEVLLGTPADPDTILSLEPEVVVLATGAEPVPVSLGRPGQAMAVEEALAAPDRVGARVVVVDDDGGYRGCGVAEHFARNGRAVRIVTRLAGVAADLPAMNYGPQVDRLTRLGVGVLAHREVVGMDGRHLVLRPAYGGAEELLEEADSVLVAGIRRARIELVEPLAGMPGVELRVVGDCLAPRDAMQAIRDGHEVGRTV